MSITISPAQTWTEDDELDGVVMLLGGAVAGKADVQGGLIPAEVGVGANCNAGFENATFAIRDFCWCEGSAHPETIDWDNPDSPYTQMPPSGGTSSGCPMNFEHFASGLQGIWYKHLGRDNEFNREVEPGEALSVLTDCLRSIEYRPSHSTKS